jgi:hypothetical protein
MADDITRENIESCIINLTTENKDRWNKLMAAAVHATGHRLYAILDGIQSPHYFTIICILLDRHLHTSSGNGCTEKVPHAGPGLPDTATQGLLQDIESILQPGAYFRPRLDIVPLLDFASWSTGEQHARGLAW